jgi:hypothetical protein
MARELLASVATYCRPQEPLLLLADDHRPYPQAILSVFGVTRFRRRRHARGRRKHPDLKPPPGLLVGIVSKVRDSTGNLLRVKTRRLFGRLKDIRQKILDLKLGHTINTAHVERLNGTLRGQQTRLARRTRNVSRGEDWLAWALFLWRDLHHWTRRHHALHGRTPAQALVLTDHVWSVPEYVRYPVHVSSLQRAIWAERREELLTIGLYHQKHRQPLPTS